MSSKHFFDDSTRLVNSALQSIPLVNPAVALDAENKVIYRRPGYGSDQVSVVSGGGSGHEPSFAAFVGRGLLAGAVAGTIFASPSAEQVRRCILERVERAKGVLVVVMNYTGDILNFGMAVEKAKASGLEVEMVVVGDDVGVGKEQGGKVGRRGIAGTVLVHKIAGALAAKGATLKEVYNIAKLTADNIISIGASLSHVHVPGRSVTEPSESDLKDSEVEIGMGIHNEPGSERKTTDLPGLVNTMLAHLLDQSDQDRAFLDVSSEEEVVLLVNNLGGVSVLELGGITTEIVTQLEGTWKIKLVRVIAGTFMTSLNGLGFSITLLRLQDTAGPSMLELLDAPAEATGWAAAVATKTWQDKSAGTREESIAGPDQVLESTLQLDLALAHKALKAGLERLMKAEPDITNYDTITGDGDCGIGLKRGAEAILKKLERSGTKPSNDVAIFLQMIIPVVETKMDGTSGALYAIFLNALAHGLRQEAPLSPTPITPQIWAAALKSSLEALSKYTPARPGDRTLVDALQPFIETLEKTGDVKAAGQAAEEGAKSTKGMKASLGRTVYVGGEGWQGVPDPGAYGLSEFLQGLCEGCAE